MTDQKKPESIADEDLDSAQGAGTKLNPDVSMTSFTDMWGGDTATDKPTRSILQIDEADGVTPKTRR